MFSPKKAQAAVEYLQTYGWAILVISVVGIAIWQLGILSPQGGINTSSGFKDIRILDQSIKYTNYGINFTMINAGGIRAKVIETSASGDCSLVWVGEAKPTTATNDPDDCENIFGGLWIGGECWRMEVTDLDPGEKTTVSYVVCDSLHPGEQFEVQFALCYDIRVGVGWVRHWEEGVMRGYAE